MLKFGKGNAKLDKQVATFSLPAGKTCPGAADCKSMAIQGADGSRRIVDGPATKFRCFAASQEVLYRNTFNARAHNLAVVKQHVDNVETLAETIVDSLPKKAKYVRVHVSGDFFKQTYFDAWIEAARQRPDVLFYAYTKSLDFWVARRGTIPANFVLTASLGGKHDSLVAKHNLRYAKVVYSEAEAESLGLEIDHDDSHAMAAGASFALLLHGSQPKGSEAGKALSALKKAGKGGYNAKRKVKAKLPVLAS